jgi:hypothetical protein
MVLYAIVGKIMRGFPADRAWEVGDSQLLQMLSFPFIKKSRPGGCSSAFGRPPKLARVRAVNRRQVSSTATPLGKRRDIRD